MKKVFLATAVMAAVLASPAQAVVLGGIDWDTSGMDVLALTPVVPGGNQPVNIQCVICGDHQPQQSGTFGYTNFHNTGTPGQNLLYFSSNIIGGGNPGADTLGTPYDGSFLRNYLLSGGDLSLTFNIGIDINDGGATQTLESFYLLNVTQQTVLAGFNTATPVPSQNNGTGFPDYTLGLFTIALGSDIQVGDQLIFFARISNANDGPDSFFLMPTASEVPLPAAAWLFLTGIAGLGLLARKRRKTVQQA